MSSAPSSPAPFRHSVEDARRIVAAARESAIWQLSSTDVADALRELAGLRGQVEGLILRLVSEVDTRGLHVGVAPSAAGYVAALTRIEMRDAMSLVALAEATRSRYVRTGAAVASGRMSTEHGTEVVRALDALPDYVDADSVCDAEAMLIEQAATLAPQGLRATGRYLFETFASHHPDVDDPRSAAALDAADRAAAAAEHQRHLQFGRGRHGMWWLRGRLDPMLGAALAAALEPLAKPTPAPGRDHDHAAAAAADAGDMVEAKDEPDGGGPAVLRDERTRGQRDHDALAALLDLALDAGQLPSHGGERPHISVTVAIDQLRAMRDQLSAAPAVGQTERDPDASSAAEVAWVPAVAPGWPEPVCTDSGAVLSPFQLRALLCDAKVLPVVLGGEGQVLDVGRSMRTFTSVQRRALAVRDRGCVFPGCEAPVARTQAHHNQHWIDGGPTDLANASLVCGTHHREIHRQGWTIRMATAGHPELVPPAWLDPGRRPRRHHRFRRLWADDDGPP